MDILHHNFIQLGPTRAKALQTARRFPREMRRRFPGPKYVFRGCASPSNDTCPLVPRMAGGLAEWLRYFNDLVVGETAAPACFLRENAEGGRNATATKSLK